LERIIAIIILKTCTPPKREVAFTICLYEFGFSAVLIYLDKLIFVKIYQVSGWLFYPLVFSVIERKQKRHGLSRAIFSQSSASKKT